MDKAPLPLDLPAIIKALSDVPPERQRFVGVMMVMLLMLLLVAWPVLVCLIRLLH